MRIKTFLIAIISAFFITNAGETSGQWCNNSGCSASLSSGTYSINGWNILHSGFKVNVHTYAVGDTATFYLADVNGVAKSDIVTVANGASSYAMAGGIERHWALTGAWKLVLVKATGTVKAEVEQ